MLLCDTMELNKFIIIGFIVCFTKIANSYPEGAILPENNKAAIVDDDDEVKVTVENSTSGKYDWTEKWESPGRLKSWFPYHIIGKDEDGASIYLVLYGRWNFRDLVVRGTDEEVQAIDKYLEQVVDRFARDAEANNNDGSVFIFDYDGFGLSNYAHPEAARLALKQFAKLARVYSALKKGYAINANFAAELFLNSARPFLGSLFEKMEVYGTQRDRWVPRLLRDIPENVLPKAYGGTSKFNAV